MSYAERRLNQALRDVGKFWLDPEDREEMVEAILASGLLRRTWDEGFHAAVDMYRYPEQEAETNPYERQETGA